MGRPIGDPYTWLLVCGPGAYELGFEPASVALVAAIAVVGPASAIAASTAAAIAIAFMLPILPAGS